MLIEFRVENYRSIHKEQQFSMVANADTNLAGNYYDIDGLKLLKSAVIYGPNASGKSNLLKAMKASQSIVIKSATQPPGTRLPLTPFLLDSAASHETTSFEWSFFCNGVRYQMGFKGSVEKIIEEWLYAYPQSRRQLWYSRSLKKDSQEDYQWEFGTFLKGSKKQLAEKVRPEALFLSTAAQWNHEQLTKIYNWFKDGISAIIPGEDADMALASSSNIYIREKSPEYMLFLTKILERADLAIRGIKAEVVPLEKIKFSKETPENIKSELLQLFKNEPPIDIRCIHYDKNGKAIEMPLPEESNGTQRLFNLAGLWYGGMKQERVLIYDELERSLHPLLTRQLIEFIHKLESGEKGDGSQLIFATHDVTLLDPELFRRDQIWFTEKDEVGATRLYPLTDYHPRPNEALQKGYLAGRYGAIPVLEAFAGQ